MLSKGRLCYTKLTSAATMSSACRGTSDIYRNKRELFLADEQKISVGGKLILDDKETKANKTIMTFKFKELDEGFLHPTKFPPARSFLEAKDDIDKSNVFAILKGMPKGAILHGHDCSLVSFEYVLKRFTYMDNLYAKLDSENDLDELKFFAKPPGDEWKSVKEMRNVCKTQPEGNSFDSWLTEQLTLGAAEAGWDVNTVWNKFTRLFLKILPMLTYEPVWREYFYKTLEELHEDNVSYLEFRGILPAVYKLDGTLLDEIEVCRIYWETLQEFKKKNPKFFGARFIYAPLRFVDVDTFKKYKEIAKELKKTFPEFVAGFDLVGQEDLGQTLLEFSEDLLEMQNDMDFFFHSGETNWSGFSTDDNLVDAILLGTKRIGHGFAITKHPKVARIVKEQRIGIEVCPISNQVLGLVKDLRNHPATHWLTHDYPVVIAPDDPGLWGAKGTSYDWYEAFVGMAARWQDLRLLKQLAINSIQQTSLDRAQKAKLLEEWNQRWNIFIDEINSGKFVGNHTC